MTTSTVGYSYQNYATKYESTKTSSTAGSAATKTINPEVDSYTPSKNTDVTYSPSTLARSTTANKSIATDSDRQATAEHYNQILEDLRSKYSESVAMKKFDEILSADGFELVTQDSVGPDVSVNATNRVNGLAQGPTSLYAHSDKSLTDALFAGIDYDSDKTMRLQSNIYGTTVDGKPAVSTEAWAIFGATRPFSTEMKDYWQNRYMDSASQTTDIDLDSYMASLSDSDQRSVVATNSDIGSIVSNLLKQNGVSLGAGESVDIELHPDFGVIAHTNSAYNNELSDIFNSSSELYSAMVHQSQNPPPANVKELPGQFNEDGRSVNYTFNRYCTYSADEPSTVVVNDFLGVVGMGYTYAKKAGDYFDPNSDSYNTGQKVPVDSSFMNDNFHNEIMAADNAVNQYIRGAVESDEAVSGNIPRSEIEAAKDRAAAKWMSYLAENPMYDLGLDEKDWGGHMKEPGVEDTIVDPEPIPEEPEEVSEAASLVNEKGAQMKDAVAILRARYSALFSKSNGFYKYF